MAAYTFVPTGMMWRPFKIISFLLLFVGCFFAARPLWAHWLLYSAKRRSDNIYGAYRPFAYRWAGAPYTPKAGSHDCVSAPETQIDRLLLDISHAEAILGQTSRSLQYRGRASLLACQAEDSISKYKLALLSDPDNPDLQLELGVSYALDASDDRAIQYEAALEHILRAGHLKRTPEFLFDSALLFEQAQLPIEAIEQWDEAVREGSSSAWNGETNQRLTAARAAFQRRAQQISALSSPDSFLAVNDNEQRDGEEVALGAATQTWLSENAGFGKNDEALRKLAHLLRRDHGDHWLTDILGHRSSGPNWIALHQLSRAIQFNLKGEHRHAAEAATTAEALFSKSRNTAGALRSRIELVYSLDRRAQANECLAALGGLESKALRRRYIWIASQARLEHVTCLTRTRQIDVIETRQKAYQWVRSTGYEGLSLRSLGFLTEPYVASDSRLTLWRRDEKGLRTFWQLPLPALRGYSFYYTLADSAQKAGNRQAAVAILREGTLLLKGSDLKLIRGILLSSLGQWEVQAGLQDSADQTFSEMGSEFRQLDFDEIGQVWDEAEVAHAEAWIVTGRTTEALNLLNGLTRGLRWPYRELNSNVRRVLLPAFGNGFLRKGDLQNACKNFLQSISESQNDMASVHDRAQRDNALREVESSWRGLTEVELRLHHPAEALAIWEAFRSEQTAGHHEIAMQNCASNIFPPIALPAQDFTIIVYSFLPSGLSGWVVSRQGIQQQWLDQSALDGQIDRFLALVSEPTSTETNVSEAGTRLYKVLLSPLAAALPRSGTLIIDADKELATIPWSAIEIKPSHPLIETFAISQSIGLTEVVAHLDQPDHALDHPIIFGPPTLQGELRVEYAPLPDATREVERIHQLLPNSVLFLHEHATFESLRTFGPGSSLFHFAGHAVSNAGFSALLMPSSDPHVSSRQYVRASEVAELDLRHMSTVVLAACASGSSQDVGAVDLDSLTGAFLEAGVRRVVATEWAVDSTRTADLMSAFYRALIAGENSSAALRQAQLTERRQTPHPYYWAGFQVFGAP